MLLINGQANSSRMEKRGKEYFCQKFSNLKIKIKQHKRILLNEGIYRMNISDLINKNRPSLYIRKNYEASYISLKSGGWEI